MIKISGYQLFAITFLFQLGTTVIFGFASGVGRDAWIVTLMSAAIGILLIRLYVSLMKMNEGLTLVEWYPRQFGKWIGLPIAWLYPLLFLFDAGRIVGDLRDLIPTTLLPTTPPLVVTVLFLLVVVYGLYLGLENLSRVGEFLVPVIFLLFAIEIAMLAFSRIIEPKYVKPLLWEGWGPVLDAVFPEGITQTYGETIAFAMIWTSVNRPERIWRHTLLATLLSSLVFLVFDLLSITIFGGVLYERSVYPYFTLTGMVNIGGFITNVNPFAVMYFISTSFFKLFLKAYTALAAVQILVKTAKERRLIWPAALVALVLGFTVSDNVAEHLYVLAFKAVTPYVWVPLFIVFPVILYAVTWIRQKAGRAGR